MKFRAYSSTKRSFILNYFFSFFSFFVLNPLGLFSQATLEEADWSCSEQLSPSLLTVFLFPLCYLLCVLLLPNLILIFVSSKFKSVINSNGTF